MVRCGVQVSKWVFRGERPYWWVAEQGRNISLQQTALTCETGPGFPSGHQQATAVVWLCLLDAVQAGPRLGRLVFTAVQLAMFLSRVFIAAHFPHQCLAGLLAGTALVGRFYRRGPWLQYRTLPLLLISTGLVCSALATFYLLTALGLDPNWSIQLAKRHCQNPDWIYVDTTPFYTMIRFSAAAVGLSLSGFLSMDMFTTPRWV